MKFLPTSDAERAAMLSAIGARSIDDLFAAVPNEVRKAPDLPPPMSEIEIRGREAAARVVPTPFYKRSDKP